MKTGNYLIIKESHDKIFINKIIIDLATGNKAIPVLWCRNGLFSLVPKEVVQNAMNSSKSFQQTDLKRTPPMLFLVWSQGIPISNQAGRALIGE